MIGLRAILVSVDYADLLAVTMTYNRHHYDEVYVVTSTKDEETAKVVADNGGIVLKTDLFWENGAAFNKWRALEWGLDQMGRHGWLCVMDADVLWPKEVKVAEFGQSLRFGWSKGDLLLHRGELMSPLRRMAPWPCISTVEDIWGRYPIHRNVGEWAGYSQVFHASDPVLGPAPWHEIDWTHAGGADSLFQRKWPNELKRRPEWKVLHLGEPGQNWFGRATPMADGSVPEGADEKRELVAAIWAGRRRLRSEGATEAEQFKPEKLG